MSLTAKNLFVIMAREVTTDAADQMNSIIKVIERFGFGYNPKALESQGVELGKQPIVFGAHYSVATSWLLQERLKKPTSLVFKLHVVDQDGKAHGGPVQEQLVPAGIDRLNVHFAVEGMPVSNAGKYTLKATFETKDGTTLAEGEYPFIVDLNEE